MPQPKKCITCDHIESAGQIPPGSFDYKWRCTCHLPKWLFGGNPALDEDQQRIADTEMTGCPAHFEADDYRY